MPTPWYLRFLTSTRGRLIALLRRDTQTVDDLAAELDLTDNAVRAHLAALEADGIVRRSGVRRDGGVGKPAYAYTLTDEADQIFPKPYAVVLKELLDALDGRISPGEVEEMLRSVGKRIAREYPSGRGDTRARLESAIDALNQLGGLVEAEDRGGTLSIQGYGCPLATVVPSHPEVCHLAEAFAGEVAGLPFRECCNRDATPRCRFELIEQP